MAQSYIQSKKQGNKNSKGDGESGEEGCKCLKKEGLSNVGVLHKTGDYETSTNYIAAKLASDNKTKEFISSQKLGSCDLQQVANAGLNKVKSDIPHLLNSPEVLPSPSKKAQFLVKTFLRTLTLVENVLNNP